MPKHKIHIKSYFLDRHRKKETINTNDHDLTRLDGEENGDEVQPHFFGHDNSKNSGNDYHKHIKRRSHYFNQFAQL